MTRRWDLPLLSALAMSVGWGFRGDYGHEAGAMVPGALVALAIVLGSGRPDWWGRGALLAMLGAVGWAFGGQMSYGRIVGFTAHSSYPDVLYGFACLFAIGALWGGIGSGILALGITRPRSELERFAGPLTVFYVIWAVFRISGIEGEVYGRWPLRDSDWFAATTAIAVAAVYGLLVPRSRRACGAIALLAAGWWVGLAGLTLALGLRMTPPRGDNWAGCVGLYAALVVLMIRAGDRAALWLSGCGLLAGGIGFAVGDLLQIPGRAGWGPIGRFEALQGLDYWKWMEQSFGLVMGLGVGLAFARAARAPIAEPVEDEPDGPLRLIAPLFLLVPMLWENLFKNVRNWAKNGDIRDPLFGLAPSWWFLIVGLAVSAAVGLALIRARRGELPMVPEHPMGRAQWLFLLILWTAVIGALLQAFPGLARKGILLVHTTFWLTAAACSLIVVSLPATPAPALAEAWPPDDTRWRPGWVEIVLWLAVPLLLAALASLATATHEEPLPGSQRRFDPADAAAREAASIPSATTIRHVIC